MNTSWTFLVAVNIAAWLIIHLGFAWLGTRLPAKWFRPDAWWFRNAAWERRGRVYQSCFRVKSWKDIVPDGASWFRGGFPKAKLTANRPDYLERFVVETCRGELVHWVVALSGLLFFLWNPPAVGALMVLYAALANLPCIIIQRYNRVRLTRLLQLQQTSSRPAPPSTGGPRRPDAVVPEKRKR